MMKGLGDSMIKIKWGIMGPGVIAHSFVKGLQALPDATIFAVGARSMEKAAAFAQLYDIPNVYGSYEEMLNNPEVDIVYIATPHTLHKECTLMCLKAGKAVLCEKPFTINAQEAQEVIDYAKKARLFLMEAMWTRFLPAIVKVRDLLKKEVIGEIRQVKADFGFRCAWEPKNRLLNLRMGGGALLDVGIYPISLASMIFGVQPDKIQSIAHLGDTGVDEQFMAVLGYGDGKIASLSGAIRTDTPQDAWIIGTKGYIRIPDFWHAASVILCLKDKQVENIQLPYEATGYGYEAAEAMRCLRQEKLESDIMPLQESLSIMQTMDIMRKQWGLAYHKIDE
jgi:dihydrodiol dehydrogenase / D-xylose 1-dehydrogenase (NADP)